MGPGRSFVESLSADANVAISLPKPEHRGRDDCSFVVIEGEASAVEAAMGVLRDRLSKLMGNAVVAEGVTRTLPLQDGVYVYVDWSNITIGARQLVEDPTAGIVPLKLVRLRWREGARRGACGGCAVPRASQLRGCLWLRGPLGTPYARLGGC